jgi:hypothetical protein
VEVAAVRFRSLEPEDTFERLHASPFDRLISRGGARGLTWRRADALTLAEIHHELMAFSATTLSSANGRRPHWSGWR